MTARSIVCAGYMPLDVITHDGQVSRHAGGTAANVAAILAYLGWRATLAGQTGDDGAGQLLIDDLRRAGVDVGQVHRPSGMATPRLIHSVWPDGHAFAYSCPACRRTLPRSRPQTVEQARVCADALPQPTVYCFDRANAATLQLAERYAATGSVIVYEPSVPANAELLRRAVVVAHIVKHSDERAVGGLDELGVEPRRGQLRIVTHGTRGLDVRSGGGELRRYPAPATFVADSAGAGDWTTAGLIATAVRSRGLDSDAVEAGVRFGQALAALSCTAIGARGLMALSRRTVLTRVQAVLADGGVIRPPRFARPAPQVLPGTCPTCLLEQAADSATTRVA
jgi:fructokinase